eukprot:Clim_evm31s144 gene=Clim_evmTU31s144
MAEAAKAHECRMKAERTFSGDGPEDTEVVKQRAQRKERLKAARQAESDKVRRLIRSKLDDQRAQGIPLEQRTYFRILRGIHDDDETDENDIPGVENRVECPAIDRSWTLHMVMPIYVGVVEWDSMVTARALSGGTHGDTDRLTHIAGISAFLESVLAVPTHIFWSIIVFQGQHIDHSVRQFLASTPRDCEAALPCSVAFSLGNLGNGSIETLSQAEQKEEMRLWVLTLQLFRRLFIDETSEHDQGDDMPSAPWRMSVLSGGGSAVIPDAKATGLYLLNPAVVLDFCAIYHATRGDDRRIATTVLRELDTMMTNTCNSSPSLEFGEVFIAAWQDSLEVMGTAGQHFSRGQPKIQDIEHFNVAVFSMVDLVHTLYAFLDLCISADIAPSLLIRSQLLPSLMDCHVRSARTVDEVSKWATDEHVRHPQKQVVEEISEWAIAVIAASCCLLMLQCDADAFRDGEHGHDMQEMLGEYLGEDRRHAKFVAALRRALQQRQLAREDANGSAAAMGPVEEFLSDTLTTLASVYPEQNTSTSSNTETKKKDALVSTMQSSEDKGKTAMEEPTESDLMNITQAQAIMGDSLGMGYIWCMLVGYNNNQEAAIDAMLEGTGIPGPGDAVAKDADCTDRAVQSYMRAIRSDPSGAQSATGGSIAADITGPQDSSHAVPISIDPDARLATAAKKRMSKKGNQGRRNVKRSAEESVLGRSGVGKSAEDGLDVLDEELDDHDRVLRKQMIAQRYEFDIYDDEYDDTYDSHDYYAGEDAALTADERQATDQAATKRSAAEYRVSTAPGSSGNSIAGKIRINQSHTEGPDDGKQEQKEGPWYKGVDRTQRNQESLRARNYTEKHKGRIANHNRKAKAAAKMGKGG